MIYYAEKENLPKDYSKVTACTLRVTNTDNAVTAKLLLTIPNGEYLVRQIISNLLLARANEKSLDEQFDFSKIYYTLGEPEAEKTGTVSVNADIYAKSRTK
jgi:hypothetical protein